MNSKKEIQLVEPPSKFADIDRYHLKHGLFQMTRSLPYAIDKTYELSDGGSLRVIMPKPLRIFDAILICTLLEKMAQNKIVIPPYTTNEKGVFLRNELKLDKDSLKKECLVFETTFRKITEAMGLKWKGATSVHQIKESLLRLLTTTFVLKRKKEEDYFHLVSSMHIKHDPENIKKGDATVAFCINPVLSEAILGRGHYARIDMDKLRSLSPQLQLMFLMISNLVDPGKQKNFNNDQLREILYGDILKQDTKETTKSQKKRAKQAILSLNEKIPGWHIEENEDKTITVKRDPIRMIRKYRKKKKSENNPN